MAIPITAAALESVIVANLWSLKEFIFEQQIGHKPSGYPLFYFKLEEGSFIRPSFFIKVVNSTVIPHHAGFRELQLAMMVQYFGEDFYDTQIVSNQLQLALSGAPNFADVILHQYDFSQLPPQKISITGRDNSDGILDENCLMGTRIDPTTISSTVSEEDNRNFNANVTFTMNTPVLRPITAPFIEDVTFDILTGSPLLPEVVHACARSEVSVEIS